MKKIECWEDFESLPEVQRKSVSDYYNQTQLVSAYQQRLVTAGVPVGIMLMTPALFTSVWGHSGVESLDTLVSNMANTMWISAVIGIGIFSLVAGVWTLSQMRQHAKREKIKTLYGIDVKDIDLMELRMEFERRTL